ncbi:hypothetical protein F443_09268, partial [Phytophthora nicotianae P1569]
ENVWVLNDVVESSARTDTGSDDCIGRSEKTFAASRMKAPKLGRFCLCF